MRRRGVKKMDWVGAVGILLLVVGAPGYLAEDPHTRDLGAWQDFVLPAPRIGDRVVFDLVVQETGRDPVRVPAVMEVVHRAPAPDEVPPDAFFVHEVRFRATHADLGFGTYHRNGSVHREYFNDTQVLVWKQSERVEAWAGERVAFEETFHPARLNERPWVTLQPGWVIGHKGDLAATFDQFVLERSPMLHDFLESKFGSAHQEVRDRLRYENETLYGGKASPYWELMGKEEPVLPCLQQLTQASAPIVIPSLPNPGNDPSFPAPGTTVHMPLPPGLPETEQVSLRVGPHVLEVAMDPSIRLCHVGTDHAWYHPDVPFVAGDHLRRGDAEDENWSVQIDLVPSKIVRGTGPALRIEPEPRTDPFDPIPQEHMAPIAPELHYLVPALPPIGPRVPIAELQRHDTSFVGATSLAALDGLVQAAALPDLVALQASGAVLAGFIVDAGNATDTTTRWALLYATPDGRHTAAEVEIPAEGAPTVRALPCTDRSSRETRRGYTCADASIAAWDPTRRVVDPAWLHAAVTERIGHAPHAFSYEPLSGIGTDWHEVFAPLTLHYDFANTLTPSGAGRAVAGVAQYTDDHVDPHHVEAHRTTERVDRGIIDLRNGVPIWARTARVDAEAAVAPASATSGATVHQYERAPIPSGSLAAGGFALVLLALIWRLLGAAKVSAAYPFVSAFYARIEKDQVLAHGRREELMRLLEADPGLTPSAIAEKTEWGWGATVHHLETLRKNGQLIRMQVGRSQHYFPLDVPDKATRLRIVVTRTAEIARFLDMVEHAPGISLKDLDARTKLKRPALSKIGSKLVAYGLVTKERDGKLTRFYPTVPGPVSLAAQDESVEADAVVA